MPNSSKTNFFEPADVASVPADVSAALKSLARARFPRTWRIAHNAMLAGYEFAVRMAIDLTVHPNKRLAEHDRKPRAYIAGPYTLGDPAKNVVAAIAAGEKILGTGGTPFVPHLSHLWQLISPHEHAYWMALDLAWLATCDCLIRLPGESKGADMEVAAANRLGIPVLSIIAWDLWIEHWQVARARAQPEAPRV